LVNIIVWIDNLPRGIGRTKGILRPATPPSAPRRRPPLARGNGGGPSAPPPPAAVARSAAQRSLDMPLRMGDGRASRVLRGDGLRTAGFGKLGGGRISNGISKAQRYEIHRRCAHVADEITPRVVGLVESEYLLATGYAR